MKFSRTALLMASLLLAPAAAQAAPVLLISIDGMMPSDIAEADKKGLKIPTIRELAANGTIAKGVKGVLPTITYPSHTTMITGVHPAKHGIYGNVAFDPEGRNQGGWMWYAQDIKVQTLWDTVHAKGGTVISIGWPASVGKQEITYNIPEFWRARIAEDEKLLRTVSTPRSMPDEIEKATGTPFTHVALDHDNMDGARMQWVGEMYGRYRPQLTTLHIVKLDAARHKFGPDSAEAYATLERIDQGLKPMIEKARAAMPDLVVAVVSDHGFLPTAKGLNIAAAFAEAGLIKFDPNGKVAAWAAMPWALGGSGAIILKNPGDKAVEARVGAVLQKLAADPANGINKVLNRSEIANLGGTPNASHWVDMKSGYYVAHNSSKELVQDISGRGGHGFSPDQELLRAAFILNGPGIARKKLDVIDMRDVAPTLGDILEAPLATPDGRVLSVRAASK